MTEHDSVSLSMLTSRVLQGLFAQYGCTSVGVIWLYDCPIILSFKEPLHASLTDNYPMSCAASVPVDLGCVFEPMCEKMKVLK
jgi:hypothetical protein